MNQAQVSEMSEKLYAVAKAEQVQAHYESLTRANPEQSRANIAASKAELANVRALEREFVEVRTQQRVQTQGQGR